MKYIALALGAFIGVAAVLSILLGIAILAVGICSRIRRAWDDLHARRRVFRFTQREKLTEEEEWEAAKRGAAWAREVGHLEEIWNLPAFTGKRKGLAR